MSASHQLLAKQGLRLPPAQVQGNVLVYMAGAAQMGMLFVRDRGGISHSPLEFVAAEDIAAAAAALYMYLRKELQL